MVLELPYLDTEKALNWAALGRIVRLLSAFNHR